MTTRGTPVSDQYSVRRSNQLWQDVADSLLQRIVSGEFPADSTLPGEAVLAENYGVSRPSMRDAMKVLQEKGLVRIHHGVGSVVQGRDSWSVLDSGVISARLAHEDVADEIFDELTTVRIALESEMAWLAAQRIDDAGKAQLLEQLASMDLVIRDPDAYLEVDMQFHDLVMQLSGNRFARAIMSSIQDPLRQSRRITNRIPDGVQAAHDFHRAIHERILEGDADGAANAMREHLTWSWDGYRALRSR